MSSSEHMRIAQAIKKAVKDTTNSGAGIDYQYGVIHASDGITASAYIAGDTDTMWDEFMLRAGDYVAAGDYVQVSIDDRGHRWIEKIIPFSDYPMLVIDSVRGIILTGDGDTIPSIPFTSGGGGGGGSSTIYVQTTDPGAVGADILWFDTHADPYWQMNIRNKTNTGWTQMQTGINTYYQHTQGVASATWNVAHNLNRYPSVSIIDSSGNEVEGSVHHTDLNNLVITFGLSFSGKANCT